MDFRLKKYVDDLKKTTCLSALACDFESCPLFQECAQIPDEQKLFGKKKAKVFFVFDSAKDEDTIYSAPAVSDAGKYFRDKWLSPFISEVGGAPYIVTHLIRTPLARNATQAEAEFCWQHFYDNVIRYKPDVIVAFGNNVYNQLYKKAKNKQELPDPDTNGVGKLRLTPLSVQLADDYKAVVFVGYDPSFILKSPASVSFFTEDRDRVINHFCPNKKIVVKPSITIDKIDLIDTVDGALDFIDFLTRGLPQNEMFDLAFDVETENLNRVYNNKFLSWQFSWTPTTAVFIPIEHPDRPIFEKIEDKVKLISAFQKLLNSSPEKSRIAWILGHNIKFDLSILYGLFRILPRGTIPLWDTLLGMHWLDENRKSMSAVLEGKPYSLKTLGKEIFDFSYKSSAIEARADGDLVSLSFNELVEYGGSDTILTYNLKQEQMRLAAQQPDGALLKLERFMRYYYSPASRAVGLMECNGIWVSKDQLDYLQADSSPIWNRLAQIEHEDLQESPEVKAFRNEYQKLLQGESDVNYEESLWDDDDDFKASDLPRFNVNKKDQETAFYLDFLKVEPIAHSKKTKKATLNKAFLNHYAEKEVYLSLPTIKPYLKYYNTPLSQEDHEGDPVFPKNPLQLILELRELSKLGNTYLASIGEMIGDKKGDCIDRRVRASFWMGSTDTGRLCLAKGTMIDLVRDLSKYPKGIPIENVKQGDLIYCVDYESLELKISKVKWAGKTGKKKVVRVHWSDTMHGKLIDNIRQEYTGYIDLTPEHLVLIYAGYYVQAKDLRIGTQLISLGRHNDCGYKILTFRSSCRREHCFVYEQIIGNDFDIVHHEDKNKLNNVPHNLKGMSLREHTQLHWQGEGNPNYIKITKFQALRDLAKAKGRVTKCTLTKDHATFIKKIRDLNIDYDSIRTRYNSRGDYLSRGKVLRAKDHKELNVNFYRYKELCVFYGLKPWNHVVTKIEYLDVDVEVYDIEVENYHNFFANEICVHNSSSNPNFQNLPSGRSPLAKEIKNLFQAEPPSKRFKQGTALIQLDYKTAEVRWAAIFANDKNLIRVFNEAREALLKACDPNETVSDEEFQKMQLASDLHRRTASLMFNVPPEQVSKQQRQASKSIGFGLLFGMGTQTLADNNGWTLPEANEKVKMFFSAFPELKTWLEANPKRAKDKGYVETIMGRRRRLGFLFATKNFRDENKASRLSMNAPIQGQSSDGGNIGMFQFLQYLIDNKLERRWLIQNVVHDSCLVQVPMEDLEKAVKAMQYYFVDGMAKYIKDHFGFTLPLPIECEIEVGLKYGDLHKWDGRPSTLPTLIEKIKKDTEKLWYAKKEKTDKPPKGLDLIKYKG